jgi:hypothetical protein
MPPMRPSRPGLVTAIGVISIVVASLSLLSSAGSLLYAVMFTAMAAVTPNIAAVPPAGAPGVFRASQSSQTPQLEPTASTQNSTDVGPPQAAPEVEQNSDSATGQRSEPPPSTLPGAAFPPPGPPLIVPVFGKPPPLVVAGVVLEALAGIGLAVLLLVAGIQTFRDRRNFLPLHRLYAVVKIPVAILGAVLWWLLYMALMRPILEQVTPQVPLSTMGLGMGISFGIWGFFGCLYPIALLIVLSGRTVRDHHASLPG